MIRLYFFFFFVFTSALGQTIDVWSNQPICVGDELEIKVLNPLKGHSYHWSVSNEDQVFFDGVSWKISNAFASVPSGINVRAVYYIRCINPDGRQVAKTQMTVLAKPKPKPPKLEYNNPVCEGNTLLMIARTDLQNKIEWTFQGESYEGPKLEIPMASTQWNKSDVFLSARKDGCTSDLQSIPIKVHANPKIDLVPDTSICENLGQKIYIIPRVNEMLSNAIWENGNTSVPREFFKVGKYWLTVQNTKGCTTTDTIRVYENCKPQVWTPEAFTPNGSGESRTFKPRAQNINSFEMTILDQEGQTLFFSDDVNIGWDGTSKNRGELPEGIYLYIIQFEGEFKGELIKEKLVGKLNLIR